MSASYEYEFTPDAINNTAAAVYRMAKGGGARILDIGSGPGIVSSYLAVHDAREVTCLDQSEEFLAVARDRGVPRTFPVDLDDPNWWRAVAEEQFDVIIIADVLEHLYDPGGLLRSIVDQNLLTPHGFLAVSIPNAAHEAVIASLITGRFQYTDTGLLDRTHIRFFTRRSFEELCESTGFGITAIERTRRTLEQTEVAPLALEVPDVLRRELNQGSLDHQTYQYVMRLTPLSEPGHMRRLQEEIHDHRSEMFETVERLRSAQKEVSAMKDEVEALTNELNERIAQVDAGEGAAESLRILLAEARSNAADVKGLLDDVKGELNDVKAERNVYAVRARQAERRLSQVYSSETWKLGQSLLWFPRKVRNLRPVKAHDPKTR